MHASVDVPCYGHRKTKPHPVKADEYDHVRAIENGGADKVSNMQGICSDCHQVKTRIDLGQRERPAPIGADGWPIERE